VQLIQTYSTGTFAVPILGHADVSFLARSTESAEGWILAKVWVVHTTRNDHLGIK
jgi:hypothetical protein